MRGNPPQWVGRAVLALDRRLRARQGICEYSGHPQCLFRIQEARADQTLRLRDGTLVREGDPLLKLHLWNEHIPEMGRAGATVGWARRASRAVDVSLRELALALQGNADWREVAAICGDMSLAAAGDNHRLVRICAHYGFEAAGGPAGETHAARRVGEGILACMLVLATNPAALRWATLRRECVRVYLSRATLETRYSRQSC